MSHRSRADEPVLVLRRGFGSRDWFEAACRVAQIHPHVLLESGAPHTLIALAGAGYGIAIVPSPVLVARRNYPGQRMIGRAPPLPRPKTLP